MLLHRCSRVVTKGSPAFGLMHQYTRRKPTSAASQFVRCLSAHGKPPPHKHIIPPMPPRPSMTVIEPPIRSRPFRPYKGSGKVPPLRKKVILNNSVGLNEYGSYPVQAVQVAQSIDIVKVISKVFATKNARKMMERLSVVVQLPRDDTHDSDRFIAVFRFGSVVFFNVAPREIGDFVQKIKSCSSQPVLTGNEIKENFCVHVQPEIIEEQRVTTGEYCIVQELNMKSVDVISNVMAQSIALDFYNDTVDELLANFEVINQKVTGTGNLTTVDRDKMFRAVARNNRGR